MSTMLELPDDLLREVKIRADQAGQPFGDVVIRLLKKGLIAEETVVEGGVDAKLLQRRRELTQEFVSGVRGFELEDFEANRESDRRISAEEAKSWSRE